MAHDSFLYLTWISFQTFRWKEKRNMKVSLIINWWNDPSESYQLFLQLFHFRNISFHQIVRGENAVQERIQIIISDFYFLVIRFSHKLYFISSSSLRTFVNCLFCLTFVYIFNKLDRLDVSMRHISAKYINAPIKIVCEKVRSFHLKRFTIFKANSHTI